MRFQRLCHVQLDLDIFEKLTVQIRIASEKQWQGGNASYKREGYFNGEEVRGWWGFHCVLKLYCLTILGPVKHFTRYHFSLYLCCFTYFVCIEIGKDKSASEGVVKFMRLTLNYIVTVISVFTHSCDRNTFT